MQPYVVKQGDYLELIAYRLGFDAATVWNDASNDDLRALRNDPNLLWPGDVLQVPAPPKQGGTLLRTGSQNSFTIAPPTVTVTLRFSDATLASQSVTIFELPNLSGLSTAADGSVSFSVPVTQQTCTVVFTDAGMVFTCNVGDLDPISTVSGIARRLQNLGYLGPYATYGLGNLDAIRDGLRAFRADHPLDPTSLAGSTSVDGESSEEPDAAAADGSSTPDASADGGKNLGDDPPPGSIPPPPSESDPPPSPAPESGSGGESDAPEAVPPPASTPVSSTPVPYSPPSPPSGPSVDDGGLADDGTLAPALAQQLVAVHGS